MGLAIVVVIDSLYARGGSLVVRSELLGSVQEATVEDPSFGKAISRLNADDFASAPLSYSSSVSEDDDGSSSNNVIDPNYTFSTDSFTNSDDEEE